MAGVYSGRSIEHRIRMRFNTTKQQNAREQRLLLHKLDALRHNQSAIQQKIRHKLDFLEEHRDNKVSDQEEEMTRNDPRNFPVNILQESSSNPSQNSFCLDHVTLGTKNQFTFDNAFAISTRSNSMDNSENISINIHSAVKDGEKQISHCQYGGQGRPCRHFPCSVPDHYSHMGFDIQHPPSSLSSHTNSSLLKTQPTSRACPDSREVTLKRQMKQLRAESGFPLNWETNYGAPLLNRRVKMTRSVSW